MIYTVISCQQINYKIVTKDKKEYQGVMDKFSLSSTAKKIKVPTVEGEKSFLSEDLTDLCLWQGDQKQVHLIYLPYKMEYSKKIMKDRISIWAVKIEMDSELKLYKEGSKYAMKSGYLEITTRDQMGFIGVSYYYKKPKDNF